MLDSMELNLKWHKETGLILKDRTQVGGGELQNNGFFIPKEMMLQG